MRYKAMEKQQNTLINHHLSSACNSDKSIKLTDMSKLISVLSYLTLFGWILAMFLYGQQKSDFSRFHLRQSLGLIITAAVLTLIPLIGWFISIMLCLIWIFCIYQAIIGNIYKLPLLGDFFQKNLDFID